MHQHSNYWVLEEEKKKGYEKFFEEITFDNFPNMEKEIVKSKRPKESYTGYTPRRNMPRHILIKLTKKKYEKQQGRGNR